MLIRHIEYDGMSERIAITFHMAGIKSIESRLLAETAQ